MTAPEEGAERGRFNATGLPIQRVSRSARTIHNLLRLRDSYSRFSPVYHCYLDDSGTSGLPIVTLGGFVAHEDQWDDLEPKLSAILNRYEVPILHAKEFHDTKPPFNKWTKIKKKSLAEELFSASHGRMLGLSVAIRRDQFEQAKREQEKWDNMSAIGVCFSSIMVKLISDSALGPAIKRQGVGFLVETGNRNNSEIEQFFKKMASNQAFEGCLRSITFIQKTSCRAIQLADFFVFYSRRHLRNQARFEGKIALPACPYLSIIQSHGPLWQQLARGAPKSTGSVIGKDIMDLEAVAALTRKPFPTN